MNLSDPTYQTIVLRWIAHELSFADMLIKRGLVLRTDFIGNLSQIGARLNFEAKAATDTFFFSALMPEGQKADR